MCKVCHFTSVHSATDGRIFEKECVSLAKAGYKVYLVAPNAEEGIRNGVHIVNVPTKRKGRLYRMFFLSRAIFKKAFSIDADIYHFHDPELLRFALRLKRKGKKVIFDSHEFYGYQIREREYIPKIIRNLIANLYMHYEAFVCRKIDAVIQVCTVMGKDYFQGRCMRSVFITNASDISAFSPHWEISFETRDKVVLVGGLSEQRGVTSLLRAMRYAVVRLVLIGRFCSVAYEREITGMPEYRNVEYLGVVEHRELPNLLGGYLAGIATLLNIGQYPKIDVFPTKICEYMAMGLPVVMSNTPYNVKMNHLYRFGICVDPSNPQEIANAINYLKEHPALALEMGQKGREAVEKYFNWKVEERKLLNLYSGLVNS